MYRRSRIQKQDTNLVRSKGCVVLKSVAIGLDDHRGPQPNNIDLFGGNDRRKMNKSATAREEITFLYDKDGTYLQDWMNTI